MLNFFTKWFEKNNGDKFEKCIGMGPRFRCKMGMGRKHNRGNYEMNEIAPK